MDTNNRFTKEKEQELIERLKEPYIYYADYRDQIEDTFIKELVEDIENDPNTPPITLFKEKIWECYEDAEYPEQQSYAADIGLDYKNLSEEDQERFDEVFMEHIYCEPDYDHFLSQDVCVNIIIDSGDYNWDLGCNQVYPHYDGDYDYNKRHGIPDDSCITWLAKKQGYNKTQTKKALLDKVYDNSRFLKSLREELLNCTSHMNTLVFLKQMTIQEWLEALEKDKITIPKETPCGLVDFWMGAGGLINIELEKDVTVTKKNIHEIIPDCCKSYSIHSIYGCTDDFWN